MRVNYVLMGAKIRSLRKNQRMNQGALAARAGISVSFLGHIERGTCKASLATVVGIAKALGASLDELLGQPWKPTGRLGYTRNQTEAAAALRYDALRLAEDTLCQGNSLFSDEKVK